MTKEKTKSIPAASLKLLAEALPSITVPVSVERPDGSKVEVNVTITAVRKSTWAEMRDGHIAELRKNQTEDGEFSFSKMVNDGAKEAAELVMKVATAWDLEDELTTDNLVALEDILPGSIATLLSNIDSALFKGRLGN